MVRRLPKSTGSYLFRTHITIHFLNSSPEKKWFELFTIMDFVSTSLLHHRHMIEIRWQSVFLLENIIGGSRQ